MKLPIFGAIGLLAPLLLAVEPQALKVRVVQSGGSVYLAGSRTSAVLTVEVIDESSRPVEGAAVSFRLPSTGAGGVFSNGLATDVVITGSNGRAAVSGVRWNKTPGFFELRVTAAKGRVRGTAAVPQRLLARAGEAGTSRLSVLPSRNRLKYTLIVAGIAAGSVVAGLAVARRPSNSGQPAMQSASVSVSVSVGMPTAITIGGP